MKKVNEFRDTRFEVSNDTSILNGIKKNNQTMKLLSDLDDLISKLYTSWCISSPGNELIYKDKEGNKIEPFEFWDYLTEWSGINQNYITKDSAKLFDLLTKKRVA
jgi:hypothetical protein